MGALPTRTAIIVMAALFGATLTGRDAQAQTRVIDGLTFAPYGNWTISASADDGEFTPIIQYPSNNSTRVICCGPDDYCYFKREDNPAQRVVAVGAVVGNVFIIGGLKPFAGLSPTSGPGKNGRVPISITVSCHYLTSANHFTWTGLGQSELRPNRFTLVVNP
jgi:hypothetical protein